LSVFRGGWTIEAAEAVCEEPEALDFLTRLRECSLIVTEEKPSEIASVCWRRYANMRLSQLGNDEAPQMERRYAIHFMAMAEDSEPHLRGPEQAMWLERLDSEQDNFRAVLAWAVEHDATGALRLAAALAPFWETRGHYSEGRNWLERALAKSTPQEDHTQPRLERSHPSQNPHAESGSTEDTSITHNVEEFSCGLADNVSQSRNQEQLLQTAQDAELEVLRARSLCGIGRLAWYEMDLVTARALLEESLSIFRKCGDGIGLVSAINSLILVLSWQGEYSLGLSLLHEGKTILQQMPDRERILPLMANFGWAISWLSVPEAQDDSWAINSEVERLARAANDKRSLAWALNGLGMCCYWQEDYAKARSFLQECEIYFVDLGEFNGMGHTAWAISNVERRQGRYAEAYTLNA
jgi:non-specific serine/threonine protein kinase